MSWTLALDLILLALLAATIGYALVLNRKLAELRRNRAELEAVFGGFQTALARAETSVGHLKGSTDTVRERIDKAQGLADDLAFLVERGEALADTLEARIRSARDLGVGSKIRPVATNTNTAAPAGGVQPRSEAERELLRALGSRR